MVVNQLFLPTVSSSDLGSLLILNFFERMMVLEDIGNSK